MAGLPGEKGEKVSGLRGVGQGSRGRPRGSGTSDCASLCLQGESGEPGPKGQVSSAPATPPSFSPAIRPRPAGLPGNRHSPGPLPLLHLLPLRASSHPALHPSRPGSKESAESPATGAPAGMRELPECRATLGPLALEDWLETVACRDRLGDRAWR